ncbi:hypothetical protein KKI23_01570 [Patescibacteria group bacterium]|nr:hypothetical protein [Patescibacteria group bacterium]
MGPVHLLANDLEQLVAMVQHLKFGPSDMSKSDVTIVYPRAGPDWFIQGKKDAGHQPVYTTVDGDGVCSDNVLQAYLLVLIDHGLPFATVTGTGDQVCRIVWSKTNDITDRGVFMTDRPGSGVHLHQQINRWARRPLPDSVRGYKLPFDFSDSALVGLPYHGDLPARIDLTEDEELSLNRIAGAMSLRLNDGEPFITQFRGEEGEILYLWA